MSACSTAPTSTRSSSRTFDDTNCLLVHLPMVKVAVAVPLRDERVGLPKLIAALVDQEQGGWNELRVCLLFDGYCEQGLGLLQSFENAHCRKPSTRGAVSFRTETIERQPSPNAGAARRRAVDLTRSDPDSWQPDIIMTTDGDTVPAANWVSEAVAALSAVDIVAGDIERDTEEPLPSRDRLEAYLRDLHDLRRAIDPLPWEAGRSHPFVGGANLSFRASVYDQLGGFEPIACHEDKRIVEKARQAGLRVRQSRQVRVVTSSRRVGRAIGGLSDILAAMALEASEPMVQSPALEARQYALGAWARRLRDDGGEEREWNALATAFGTTSAALRSVADEAPNGEAFSSRAMPAPMRGPGLPLTAAALELTGLNAADFRIGHDHGR